MRLALLLVLLSSPAFAQLGPGRPPPGANEFRRMSQRAEWVRDAVLKVAPRANGRCIYAVALEMVGLAELAWSDNVVARGKHPRSVRKGEAEAFKRSLHENARSECYDDNMRGPPGGMYETTKGLLTFASDQEDWMKANYERLKVDVIQALEGFAKMGTLVPAAEGGAAAFPVLSLPILNPDLFMPPQEEQRL